MLPCHAMPHSTATKYGPHRTGFGHLTTNLSEAAVIVSDFFRRGSSLWLEPDQQSAHCEEPK